MLFTRAIFILISTLFSFVSFSQINQNDTKRLKLLLTESQQAYKDYNDSKSFQVAKEASSLAIKTGDLNSLSKSYFQIARVLANYEFQEESMDYVKKIENLKLYQNDPLFKAKVIEIKAFNYSNIELNLLAINEYKSIIELLKQNQDFESKKKIAQTYWNIGSIYQSIKKYDSVNHYLKKQEEQLKKMNPNESKFEITEFYHAKGYYFLEQNKLDSALFYFNKTLKIKVQNKEPLLVLQYNAFGDYYFAKKDYKKAIEYYTKAIENAKQFKVKNSGILTIYKYLSESYGNLNNINKENYYLKQYSLLSDSIAKSETKKIDQITSILLNEKEEKTETTTIIYIIITTLIFSGFFGYYIYRKYFVTKKEYISALEIERNQSKISFSEEYEEVINLAKSNNKSFYSRFQKLYPEFQKKLLDISSDLQLAELTLLAYIHLDFQTKEIADFTFKSVRTIQNQKASIRKKLNMDRTENFNLWVKKTIDNQ